MAPHEDMKALFELGVSVGELKARIAVLVSERDEARDVIRKADGMVNGYADNDYRIAEEVLRPYLAKYLTPTRGPSDD